MRETVKNALKLIGEERQNLKTAALKKMFRDLCDDLITQGTKLEDAYQFVEDAIRYVKQHLADIGMHTPAFELAILQNKYRALIHKALGHHKQFVQRKVGELLTGYLNSWWQVLKVAVAVCIAWTVFYLLYYALSGNPTLVYGQGEKVPILYYPYFSVVTFATLGYGDMQPNTHVASGWIPAYLACSEAVLGIVTLGLFVYVLVNRMGAHPLARPWRWFDEYEQQVLKASKEGSGTQRGCPHFCWICGGALAYSSRLSRSGQGIPLQCPCCPCKFWVG